jgi:hypothetical protein
MSTFYGGKKDTDVTGAISGICCSKQVQEELTQGACVFSAELTKQFAVYNEITSLYYSTCNTVVINGAV